MHLKKHVENRFLTRSKQEDLAISQPAILMQRRQKKNSDGLQSADSKKCVKTHGDGRARIQMDIIQNNKKCFLNKGRPKKGA